MSGSSEQENKPPPTIASLGRYTKQDLTIAPPGWADYVREAQASEDPIIQRVLERFPDALKLVNGIVKEVRTYVVPDRFSLSEYSTPLKTFTAVGIGNRYIEELLRGGLVRRRIDERTGEVTLITDDIAAIHFCDIIKRALAWSKDEMQRGVYPFIDRRIDIDDAQRRKILASLASSSRPPRPRSSFRDKYGY